MKNRVGIVREKLLLISIIRRTGEVIAIIVFFPENEVINLHHMKHAQNDYVLSIKFCIVVFSQLSLRMYMQSPLDLFDG